MRYTKAELRECLIEGLIIAAIIACGVMGIGVSVLVAHDIYQETGKYFFFGLLGVIFSPIVFIAIGMANEKYEFIQI